MVRVLRELVEYAHGQRRTRGAQDLTRGGLSGIAITLTNRALTIVSAVLLAKLLGPAGYGVYASAIAIMAILAVFCEGGLYSLVVREVAKAAASDRWGELIGVWRGSRRVTLRLAGAAFVGGQALVWLTPLIDSPSRRLTMAVMLLMVPVMCMLRLQAALLSGLRRLSSAQFSESFIVPSLCFLLFAGALALARDGLTPPAAMILQAGAALAGLVVVSLVTYRALATARASGQAVEGGSNMLRRALSFWAIGAAGVVAQQLDTVIVSLISDDVRTAHYRVAAQGATLTWLGLQILQSICAPFFSRLYHGGKTRELAQLFYIATAAATACALAVVVVLAIFGKPLIAATFGPEYVDAYGLLLIIAIGYLINVACGPVGTLLAMTGHEALVSHAFMGATAVSVVMSLILSKAIGSAGVAFSTGFCFASYHLLLRVFVRRKLSI